MALTPYTHQVEIAARVKEKILQYGQAYLAMEERTGKTLCGLLALKELGITDGILIMTKKNAMPGWNDTLANCGFKLDYMLRPYSGLENGKFELAGKKINIVILDESHNYISGFPKVPATYAWLKLLIKDAPVIYMSATPYAQGIQLLYHQLTITSRGPWQEYKTAYDWYRKYAWRNEYGSTKKQHLFNKEVETYKHVKTEEVFEEVKHLFITFTRNELGFKVEPTDSVHYVKLNPNTRMAYNHLVDNKVLKCTLNGRELVIDGLHIARRKAALHMMEGGALKFDSEYLELNNNEKIDYIKEHWGDVDSIAIMYNYIAEGNKLRRHFKQAKILQATSYAEGVDLSHIGTLIIYSQDFSVARHTQRRARQAGKTREHKIVVHYLLVKGAVSEQLYKSVTLNKKNYIDSLFENKRI